MKYIHIVVQPSPPSTFWVSLSSPSRSLYPSISRFPWPLPPPLTITILLFVSMNLSTLGTSKQNYRIFILLCLAYSTGIILPRFICAVAEVRMAFLFNVLHLCIYILFVHSSADGHLGCLLLLVSVNKAAMIIDAQLSVWICVTFNPGTSPFLTVTIIIPKKTV